VVSLTEELALRQAKQADEEIAAGAYRGPLHGIPFGLKDLLAVRGTKTTWGMSPFKDRVIDADATSTAGWPGRRDPGGQALDRCARRHRAVVRRAHAKSVEHRAGRLRLFGRPRLRDRGRSRRLFDRDRHRRVDSSSPPPATASAAFVRRSGA
jgi:hypothetical protein